MKFFWSILFVLLASFSFAQDEDQVKAFKKSTNKYYVGASVSPVFVAFLNGESIEPEWRIAYKQRLGKYNHYFRLSYNFTTDYYNGNFPLDPFTNSIDQTTTIAIDTNLYWRSGLQKYHNNQHFVKLGYEYQFKIGKQRNISINLGADAILGTIGSALIAVNDTFQLEQIEIGGGEFRESQNFISTDHTKLEGPQFAAGLSPYLAVGFPLKKHFDLTFEMNYDINFSSSKTLNTKNINIDYRPSLILSYRFDEAQVRKDGRKNKTSR